MKITKTKEYSLSIVIMLITAIFVTESFLNLVFHLIDIKNKSLEPIIEAIFLVILLTPTIYFFVFKTLAKSLDQCTIVNNDLEKQKNFTESLLHDSSMPLFVIDKDHKVIYWNKACEELTGVKQGDIIGKSDAWRIFYNSERPLLAEKVIDGTIDSDFRFPEIIIKSSVLRNGFYSQDWFNLNGKRRYIVYESAPIYDDAGEITAAVETLRDITERKKLEDSFVNIAKGVGYTTGLDFFSSLVLNLSKSLEADYVFIGKLSPNKTKTVKTVSVYGNGEFIENFEYSLVGAPCERVIKKSFCIFPSNVRKSFPDDKMLLELNIEAYAGVPLIDSNGNVYGLLSACFKNPIFNTSYTKSVLQAFSMRITAEMQRLESEKSIQEKSAQLSTLIENINIGLIFGNSKCDILYVNKAFGNIIGINDLTPLIGTNCRELIVEFSKNLFLSNDFIKKVDDIVASRGALYNYELSLKDNRIIKFDYITILNDLEVIGYIWQFTDITESRKLEEQLLQAQKMEAVGQLAGGVAHDFNNILTGFIGYLSILCNVIGDNEKAKKYITQLNEATDRAVGLTQSLLAFSRKHDINLKPENLNEILTNLKKLLSRVIGEDIELVMKLFNGETNIFADKIQIEQIVMNFATNSRDAMPNGGKIYIETDLADETELEGFQKENDKKYIRLSFRDTGIGIDEKTQKTIFEPFFTTKEVGKGTGLGLSIVYGIVKQHNGFIKVESKPNEGSCFKVYFPIIECNKEISYENDRLSIEVGNGETIIVAEDDVTLAPLITDILEMNNYKVICVNDGESAIKKYEENKENIAIFLLDIIMPNKNGKEVFEAVKKINSSAKAIFISGYTPQIIKDRTGLDKDSYDFISKPIKPEDMLAKIKAVLNK